MNQKKSLSTNNLEVDPVDVHFFSIKLAFRYFYCTSLILEELSIFPSRSRILSLAIAFLNPIQEGGKYLHKPIGLVLAFEHLAQPLG